MNEKDSKPSHTCEGCDKGLVRFDGSKMIVTNISGDYITVYRAKFCPFCGADVMTGEGGRSFKKRDDSTLTYFASADVSREKAILARIYIFDQKSEQPMVIDSETHWIPRSQMAENNAVSDTNHRGLLVISRWIAEQKKLVEKAIENGSEALKKALLTPDLDPDNVPEPEKNTEEKKARAEADKVARQAKIMFHDEVDDLLGLPKADPGDYDEYGDDELPF